MNVTPNQDEAVAIIALNILTGKMNPEQWKGLRRVDQDEEAILNIFQEIRQWGFGKMEVNVLHHQLDTVHKVQTFKRKDLVKEKEGKTS